MPNRLPTIDELARAFDYIDDEFRIHGADGRVRVQRHMWVEGLARALTGPRARRAVEPHARAAAEAMRPQLSDADWRAIMRDADSA